MKNALLFLLLFCGVSFAGSPDSLKNWYPLSVGNYWIYQVSFYYDGVLTYSGTASRRIVSDTTIEGVQYMKINEVGFVPFDDPKYRTVSYERYDTLDKRIKKVRGNYSEKPIERLTMNVGESDSLFRFSALPVVVKCSADTREASIAGQNTRVKKFMVTSFTAQRYQLAYGLGIDSLKYFADMSAIQIYSLRGAIIQGHSFGDTLTGIDISHSKKMSLQSKLSLQNYPNPFNSSTVIFYYAGGSSVMGTAKVSLVIFDILGREVARLINEEEQSFGEHECRVTFPGGATSGVYIARLQVNGDVIQKKIVFIK